MDQKLAIFGTLSVKRSGKLTPKQSFAGESMETYSYPALVLGELRSPKNGAKTKFNTG